MSVQLWQRECLLLLTQNRVLLMDVLRPGVPPTWWGTAVAPAQWPVHTSAVGRPVILHQPASQVSRGFKTFFLFFLFVDISLTCSPSAFVPQVVGVHKVRWWTTCSSVFLQMSVCVKWPVCTIGRDSRSKPSVSSVSVREEGHRNVSPSQTAQVREKPNRAELTCRSVVTLLLPEVHCGWSSWSDWGECLGPCGVQSVQWSFRSPNNPAKFGNGRECRGIQRKARR